jgi:hypothetical protein
MKYVINYPPPILSDKMAQLEDNLRPNKGVRKIFMLNGVVIL